MFLPEVREYWGWGREEWWRSKNMASPLPLVSREGNSWPLLFKRSSYKSEQSPVSQAFVTSLPLTCILYVPRPLAYPEPQISCILSLVGGWIQKSQV